MEQGSVDNSTVMSLLKDIDESDITRASENPPACFISWIDDGIRATDPNEYEPHQVLIGPFHRDTSHWMEKKKKNLLGSILRRDQNRREQVLKGYLNAMAGSVDRARGCYNRTFSAMNRDEFARMLLLDGCFLLSCFVPIMGSTSSDGRESESHAYDRDTIFLLENQVPFFILQEIYKLVVPTDDDSVVAQSIARHIETWVHRMGYVHSTVMYNVGDPAPCHLLHLLYMYFRPASLDQNRRSVRAQTNGGQVQLIPISNSSMTNNASRNESTEKQPSWRAATYYYAAGVRLATRKLDGDTARSILDVELKDGTLYVPCSLISSHTLTILHNMVALEQHNPDVGRHVAAYCLFMSQMARAEADVKLLLNKGIVKNFLSAETDVADGFADLCRGIYLDLSNPETNYLKGIHGELEELCRSPWRKSMAWLRHNKCNNYLMTLAVVAGVIVFLCTVEQSIFAALSYATGKP